MRYISLPSNLNGIIGITSYYCVILKIMILHDAIKRIMNKVFPCSLKKNKILFLFKKTKKRLFFQKETKNPGGLSVFKKPGFFSNLTLTHGSYAILKINFQSFSRPFPDIFRTFSRPNIPV